MYPTENTKKFSREYGHGRANYTNGPLVAGASSLPASPQAHKLTSFRTNPRRLQAHKPRVQASSQRPQAPRSWNQGTSVQAWGPGTRQQGQMSFLDASRKRLFGGVIDVLY